MTFSDLETLFKKLPFRAYIKLDLPENEIQAIPNNPADFLVKFFLEYNVKFNTILINLTDKLDLKHLVTGQNRRRSVQEVYSLVCHYFPNYSIKQYFTDLYEVIYQIYKQKEVNKTILTVHWCNDINGSVFYLTPEHYMKTRDFYPFNKFFPILICWNGTSSELWKTFYDENVCFELVGEKYSEKTLDKV